MTKRSLYLLLPANLIFLAADFIFVRFVDIDLTIDQGNKMLMVYIAACAILYGLLTAIAYAQTPNKIFLLGNLFNLAASLLINRLILVNLWQDLHWEYYVYPFTSTQALVVLWFMLLFLQCFIRLCVWLINVIMDT